MRKPLYILLFSFCFLNAFRAGCQTTPAQYSAKIDAATTRIRVLASLWGTTFLQQFNGDQHFDQLTPIRTQLQEYIEKNIAEFKEISNIGGSEMLKSSLLEFLEYERNLVEKGFGPFEQLSTSASESEVAKCRSNLTTEASREKALLTTLNSDRKAYAEKNNFPLVPPTPPKAAAKPGLRYSDLVDGELPSKSDQNAAPAAGPKVTAPSRREPTPAPTDPKTQKNTKKTDKDDDDDGDE
jgi:hypothetical protein